MFGYILPLREELKVKDWERFQAVYCGLCRTMGKRCGQHTRFLLSYDFTFLALLLGAQGDKCQCRCPVAPCRGKSCLAQDEALELAADESMILTWWKLQDELQDESGVRRMGAWLLAMLYGGAYRGAAKRCPDFDRLTQQQLAQLRRLEQEQCESIDRTADAFARILAGAVPSSGDTMRDRSMEQLLYHVGRWIYLADAWDDLSDDLKRGQYNPIQRRFSLDQAPNADSEVAEQMKGTLLHSTNLALSAFRLLEESQNSAIVENILWGGMPMVQQMIFNGTWKTGKRKKAHQSL